MGSTAIEIGQAIGGYAALIAAIIAGVAVFTTYRLRPLRIRSIELHSRQLKQTISQWLKEIISPDSPSHPAHVHRPHGSPIELVVRPEPYTLTLEEDILFRDLPNHLPASLFQMWADYKKRQNAYLQAKQELTQRVIIFATETTGIRIYDTSGHVPSEDALSHDVLDLLFRDLDYIAMGEEPDWFAPRFESSTTEIQFKDGFLRRKAYGVIWCGSAARRNGESVRESDETRSRNIYARLSQGLREAEDLIQDIREHREQYDALYQTQKALETELQNWLKVPIFPEECNLIKKGAR